MTGDEETRGAEKTTEGDLLSLTSASSLFLYIILLFRLSIYGTLTAQIGKIC